MEYRQVQQIAKDTIKFAKKNINSGMNLLQVRGMCEEKMLELGADSFWYWNIGAFVFAGDETTVSVSGKQYTTSNRIIGETDIITIIMCTIIPMVHMCGFYFNEQTLSNGYTITHTYFNSGFSPLASPLSRNL